MPRGGGHSSGGGFGGGHSSGGSFGGGRSFSSGGHHSGGHSSFNSAGHSSYRGPRGPMGAGPQYRGGFGYGPGPMYRGGYYRRSGFGFFRGILIFGLIMFLLPVILVGNIFNSGSSYNNYNNGDWVEVTTQKDKLQGVEYSYNVVDDQTNALTTAQEQQLGQDLKYFYDQTGIQPYVVISNATYLSADKQEDYAYDYYVNHFNSEDVFVFMNFPDSTNEYDMYYIQGDNTYDIMDDEAIDTFWTNLDNVWYTDDSLSGKISDAFKQTADQCMTTTTWDWVENPSTVVEQPAKKQSDFTIAKIIGAASLLGIGIIAFIKMLAKNKKKESAADIDYNQQYQQQTDSSYNPYYGDSDSYSDQYKNQNQ